MISAATVDENSLVAAGKEGKKVNVLVVGKHKNIKKDFLPTKPLAKHSKFSRVIVFKHTPHTNEAQMLMLDMKSP
nr:hypothetical protein Iba_chr05cCG4130 [Ipomoea batatas]